MSKKRFAIAAALLLFTLAGAVQAAPLPPDPRRGERLDGRAPPPPDRRVSTSLSRAVLTVPRYAIKLVLWPVVQISRVTEENHVWSRIYWALTSENEQSGVRPVILYSSGFLPTVGATYFNRQPLGRGSYMELGLRGGPSNLLGSIQLDPIVNAENRLSFMALYHQRNDAIFAGTTGETEDELERMGRAASRYEYKQGLTGVSFDHRLKPTLVWNIHGELDLREYENGTGRSGDKPIVPVWCADRNTPSCTEVNEQLVPGFNEGLRIIRLGTAFSIDTRPPGRYATGLYSTLAFDYTEGIAGDPSRTATVLGEVMYTIDLDDKQLSARIRGGVVEPLNDVPVPFELLLSPSGFQGVRGVLMGTQRGNSELLGTLEYRWLLSAALDAALFIDYGGAFGSAFTDFQWDHMIPAFGGGLRFFPWKSRYWDASMGFSFDIAWSPEVGGLQFLFAAGMGY